MTELETAAVTALHKAETGEGRFEQFMELATQVARVSANHDEFVVRTAPALAAQRGLTTLLGRWGARMERAVGIGNEDDAIDAVKLRSQLEFVCGLYRDSVAYAALDEQRDSETDDALHGLACEFGIDPEPEIPRTHRWWCWPST